MDSITRNIHYSPPCHISHTSLFSLYAFYARTASCPHPSALPSSHIPPLIDSIPFHLPLIILRAAYAPGEPIVPRQRRPAFSSFIASIEPSRGRAAQVEQPRLTRTFTPMAPSGSGPSRMWTYTDARPQRSSLRHQCLVTRRLCRRILAPCQCPITRFSVPTPSPAISRLRLTAYDHFAVVPCLAAI